MKLRDKLCIGMSLAPTWLSNEGWRAPHSGIEGLYSADFALEIAQQAEAANLDFVFRPDTTALPVPVLEQSFGFSSLDSTLMMAALVRETRRIGLVTTMSTTFAPPFTIARQMMSLHWMSGGRAGLNVVTGLQGNENFGLDEMPSSPARYARATECLDVVQKLWNSFPASALKLDRASGQYADTVQIAPIDHHGAHFDVAGPLMIPAFPGPRVPLMQAGASVGGVALAGRSADMVFGQTLDMASALKARERLSDAAIAAGRRPEAVRLLPGLSLYLADTREEARAMFVANHLRVTDAQRIARVKESLGLDLTDWPEDRRIHPKDLPQDYTAPRGPAHGDLLRGVITAQTPRVAGFLQAPEVLASVHWQVIGTVDDAFDTIAAWFEAGAIDGFVALPGGSRHAVDLTLNHLVPRLAAAGLFRSRYSGDTLLHHLEE